MPTTRTDTDHTSYACPKMRALHAQIVAFIANSRLAVEDDA